MGMTDAEVRRFREDGYIIFDGLIAGPARDHFRGVFEELTARSYGMTASEDGYQLAPDPEGKPTPGVLHKIQGVCVVDERILGLAREPRILDRVASLLGPNIDVFGTKFYPMSVAGATSTGWHQDNHYFGTKSDRVVSCAIYLDATDRDNGCLQLVPGTHRTGELVEHERGEGHMAHGSWTPVDESAAVDVVCSPGTVVLFSANVLHGARANVTGRPSFRTAWHYIPGDLALEMFPRGVYEDRHIVRGV